MKFVRGEIEGVPGFKLRHHSKELMPRIACIT